MCAQSCTQQSVVLDNVQTIAYFDRLGMPRLAEAQLLESPGADTHAG